MMTRNFVLPLGLALLVFSFAIRGQEDREASGKFHRFDEHGKWGFIDESGALKPRFDEAGIFSLKQETNAVALSLPQAQGAWLIEISRSGGMRPHKDSVSINSEGEIGVTSESRVAGRVKVDCALKEKLPAEDSGKLKQAVSSAKPSAWSSRYSDPAHPICCDQPTTSLTLQLRQPDGTARTYSTSWYAGSAKMRPADLVEVLTLAQPLWNNLSERCNE
jgi:hypothetical protein